ncbi:MAG: hypothetical protein PHS45_04655 [Bacilli bacterium]|nr:hypothetical protein [Bacilli bacterium]
MENIRGFIDMYLNADYMWIIIAVVFILIITIIGYFADKANQKLKGSLDDEAPKPRREKRRNRKNKEKENNKSDVENSVSDNNDDLNQSEKSDADNTTLLEPLNITPIEEEPISMARDLLTPTNIGPGEQLRSESVDMGADSMIGLDPLKLDVDDANEPDSFESQLDISTNNEEDNPLGDLEKLGEASIQEQIMAPAEVDEEEEELELISDDTV